MVDARRWVVLCKDATLVLVPAGPYTNQHPTTQTASSKSLLVTILAVGLWGVDAFVSDDLSNSDTPTLTHGGNVYIIRSPLWIALCVLNLRHRQPL